MVNGGLVDDHIVLVMVILEDMLMNIEYQIILVILMVQLLHQMK